MLARLAGESMYKRISELKQHTVTGSADIRVVPSTTPYLFPVPSFPANSFPSRINPAIIVLGNQYFPPSLFITNPSLIISIPGVVGIYRINQDDLFHGLG